MPNNIECKHAERLGMSTMSDFYAKHQHNINVLQMKSKITIDLLVFSSAVQLTLALLFYLLILVSIAELLGYQKSDFQLILS